MDDPSTQYSKEDMQQALQTREQYDVHGLHFDTGKATLQPGRAQNRFSTTWQPRSRTSLIGA
ncbi:hypothetical protein [Mycoplana dimorpha]|uniref:hypothetical protein n=1 Tax=Mycoplana dimorpha TaxID=28320 RepID=UPI001FDEAC06|nr:hypothetical protein [Mycoplana dimorpha]